MPSKSWGSVRVFSPRYSRAEAIALLRERLPDLHAQLPLRRVVLFGSYARGDHTAFSDLDVLVVYADPPRTGAFALVKRTLHLRGLEPHVLSESEYAGVRAVWDRMARAGTELWEGQAEGSSGE
jgi:predicted nucleotidyltransferase